MSLRIFPVGLDYKIVRLRDQYTNRYHIHAALAVATLTIFVRSCFRVAELQGGFNGKLANNQVTFMILEGAMIVIASVALTVWHPGLVFRGFWNLDRARIEMRGESEDAGVGKYGVLLSETRVG